MKKLTITTIVLSFLFTACTKKSDNSSNAVTAAGSTFSITFRGKTYNLITSTTDPTIIVSAKTTNNPGDIYGNQSGSLYDNYGVSILATNNLVSTVLYGETLSNEAIGTYRLGSYNPNSGGNIHYGGITLTDKNDGNRVYSSDYSGNDTTSTITVVTSTANECSGTFNIVLTNNSSYYSATGSFNYKH